VAHSFCQLLNNAALCSDLGVRALEELVERGTSVLGSVFYVGENLPVLRYKIKKLVLSLLERCRSVGTRANVAITEFSLDSVYLGCRDEITSGGAYANLGVGGDLVENVDNGVRHLEKEVVAAGVARLYLSALENKREYKTGRRSVVAVPE